MDQTNIARRIRNWLSDSNLCVGWKAAPGASPSFRSVDSSKFSDAGVFEFWDRVA